MRRTYALWTAAGAVATLAVVLGATAVPATDGPGEGGWRNSPLAKFIQGRIGRRLVMLSELNLTDEQRAGLKSVVDAHRPEIADLAKQIVAQRQAIRDQIMAGGVTEEAAKAAAEKLTGLATRKILLAAKIVEEAKAILTPEQLDRIKKFHAEQDQATDVFLGKVLSGE